MPLCVYFCFFDIPIKFNYFCHGAVDEFNFYRATHAKRNILSALPTVTPPTGFNLDQNNGCDFDIQMHGCLDRF